MTKRLGVWGLVLGLMACSGSEKDDKDDTETDTTGETDIEDTETDVEETDTEETDVVEDELIYEFTSRFDSSASSVRYDGQTFRHLLIEDMKAHIGGMTGRLNGGTWFPESGDVRDALEFYYNFDHATSGTVEFLRSFAPDAVQSTYADVSSNKKLQDKIAGNDPTGQHEDWTTGMIGWSGEGITTPESLVRHWFDQIDAAAVDWANGTVPVGPTGAPVTAVYLTADGLDLQQLLQKFLTGAVSYSQGADDYLDDDLAGKGMLSDNVAQDGSNPWTALEHQWDEGFGYFGAARRYATWDDSIGAGAAAEDSWAADGAIDLLTEVSWGHSTNASKRDVGALVATDFSHQAIEGFVRGRRLITDAGGALTPAQLDELRGWRDQALEGWEKAIAATVVHYINDVLRDMGTFGTPAYNFADHAKHWSELKGFALSLQFSRLALISDEDLVTLHDLLGQAPVLPNAAAGTISDYKDDLLAARDLLGTTYEFDAGNLGDDDGNDGW